jgi:hypothetical protein
MCTKLQLPVICTPACPGDLGKRARLGFRVFLVQFRMNLSSCQISPLPRFPASPLPASPLPRFPASPLPRFRSALLSAS